MIRRTRPATPAPVAAVLVMLLGAALAGCIGAPEPMPRAEDVVPQSPSRGGSDDGSAQESPTPPTSPPPDRNGTPPPIIPSPTPPPGEDGNAAPKARAVIALIDSGINPYHHEFRDPTPEAHQHPSTYVPGYPAEAEALPLTLTAERLDEALRADEAAWSNVKPGVLYWVPGTRVIGLVIAQQDGKLPGFDDDGHGTMTASRAAGATTSLAPTAKIVAIEGLGLKGVEWAAKQPWIDVQSNSWVNLIPGGIGGERYTFGAAAREQVVIVASGNGLAQYAGGLGQPSITGGTTSAPGIIVVGGHDNGYLTPWTGTIPHVAADACWSWAADASTLDKTGPRVGSGTSAAAPYVAGAAAALILKARELLGDAGVSHAGGILAKGEPGNLTGVLEDGALTLSELKLLLLHTADATPEATPHDGDVCDATMAPYATAPIGAGDADAAQQGLPSYYFVGYGAINTGTLASALAVLRGDAELPARDFEDFMYGIDATARSAMP